MDINTLRVNALKRLMGNLTQAAFADRYDLNASHISQILGGKRRLGEDYAKSLEEKIGLPLGTIVNPTNDSLATCIDPIRVDEYRIPQYDIKGSMGDGLLLPSDYIETIRYITVNKDFFQQHGLTVTSPDKLCIVTGFGESMYKTFSSGDPLIVDQGIKSIEVDGVYFFSIDGHMMIKRVQLIPGGIRIISDHDAYPPYDVKGADLESVVVHARVLIAWRSQRL